MLRIGIILGSTRPGRVGEGVAKWVLEQAKKRTDAEFELVDVREAKLPLLDETNLPGYHQYENEHTKAWAEKIGRYDGFVFVTAEYNHGIPGALKNAIDFIYAEWNNKAVGFVSYGSSGGTRAVAQLRGIMGELQMADVRAQVILPLWSDFKDFTEFAPKPMREGELQTLLDQVIAWSAALKTLRAA